LQALRRRELDHAVRRVDRTPESQQHAFGVIARDRWLDDLGCTLRVQTREQHRGLDLCARDRQLISNPAQIV
jgi:hypothetical protein